MRICVIDDNLIYLEVISKTIHSYFKDVELVLLNEYNNNLEECDFYFLDINLSDKSGIDLARCIVNQYPFAKIVFITLHDNLVYNALSIQPFYFIRKDNLSEDFEIFASLVKRSELVYNKEFKLINGLLKNINITKISYVDVFSHHLYIYDNLSKPYVIYMTMSQLLEYIQAKYLVRVHKSYAVNVFMIEKIENMTCYLKGGMEIPLGRKYKQNLIDLYKELI